MAVLDKIMEMQKKGMSTTEISRQLQNEGVTPAQINDAINQASVKNAVVDEQAAVQQANQVPQEQWTPSQVQESQQPNYNPATQAPQNMQQPQENQYPSQEYQDPYYTQTPQAYTGQEYYAGGSNTDSETISEIAEQVVIDKFSEFTKKTGDLVAFKNSMQDKIADLDNRLKRIENSIDKLQSAIIGKIGEFEENAAAIHQDIDNLHNTMSKVTEPLIDNFNELKKLAEK